MLSGNASIVFKTLSKFWNDDMVKLVDVCEGLIFRARFTLEASSFRWSKYLRYQTLIYLL